MDADGKHWTFVLAPPSRMQRRGVQPEMIAVGKTVTVFGYPHMSEPDEARIEYIVADGQQKFLSYSCNGCHGGGGGGGMCPPLTNDVWVYDGDDDTLFRLVTLGSDELQKAGYSRHGSENVVGPMPPFGTLIKSSDDLFRILTFVRSKYSANADPHYKYGTPPEQK